MAAVDEQIDLLLLQERCRKDPVSYRDEYTWQQRHFEALLSSARMQPSDPSPRLAQVASFMGAVAHCYDNDIDKVVPTIASFLSENALIMNPDLRRALVRLLGLLRARNSADPTIVIPLFFRLLECNDKALRRMLHGHIVSDIKKMNLSGHSSRRALQSFLFAMVEDPSEVLVKRSLHVLVDLFRKRIWNDAKCANMIAGACFHTATPVAVIAAKFILDSESKQGDVDSDNEGGDAADNEDQNGNPTKSIDSRKAADMWKAYNMTSKKSSKKRKRMERVINRVTRTKSASNASATSEHNVSHPSFEAMMLLHDPQEFSEKLFSDLQNRRKKESYETRLVFINLISRLVGTHQLILFNMYPFLQRYLQPSQPEVTRVLAYLTQACHDLVPPDVLHPILRSLADTFVSERSSPPAMAAGINAIRAICARVPLAILDDANEGLPAEQQEAALLLDLVQYRSSKDKGIVMAARSLLALYREVNPGLLNKRDRGKVGAVAVHSGVAPRARAYGEHMYATGVEGVELLNAPSEGDEDSEMDEDDEADADANVDVNDLAGDEKDISCSKKVEQKEAAEDSATGAEESETKAESKGEGEGVDQDDVGGNDDDVNGGENDQPKGRVDEMEILSNEDYAKIRARQAAKAVGVSGLTRNTGDAVDPDDIQGPLKRGRQTLTERMESVLEGRKGREKFGSRKGKDKGGGSTNKKKLKTKSNSMVIHKRRKGNKNCRREKQLSMRRKKDYK